MRGAGQFRMIKGPIGSGKSTVCCIEIARRAAEQAPDPRTGKRMTRWAIVRNTKQQLKDTTLKTWLQWFPDGVAGTWKESDATFMLRFADVEAEVMFRALDDPEDVKRLLSLELTGGYINELRELPLEIAVALQSRTGRYPAKKDGGATWHGLIADTNPPDADHWIFTKFEVERPRGWEAYSQPSGLSPEAENIENLPDGYYEQMLAGATQDWIDVHVHGKYGRSRSGKPVYEKTFSHEAHVARDRLTAVRSAPLLIGMDFGRTPACTFEQVLPGPRYIILGEMWDDNSGLERFLQAKVKPEIARRWPGMRVVVTGDPAGWAKSQINELSCADILRREHLVALRATTNDIAPRLEAVERQLSLQTGGRPALQIDPSAERLIVGFNSKYRYKRLRDGTYTLAPEKNEWSHIHDARQYAALTADIANAYAVQMTTRQDVMPVNSAGWT